MSDLEGHEDRLQPEEEELFQETRAAIERRWPKTLEHPEHPQCTGIGASYCEIHGECTCEAGDFPCPLHGEGDSVRVREGIFCERCDAEMTRAEFETRVAVADRVLCTPCWIKATGTGPIRECEVCKAEMDQDQFDLSTIRFRRTLCRACFDVARSGGVPRPNPTRKTY